jgi:hypothetical protein
MLNRDTLKRILMQDIQHEPYDHMVIDDFFTDEFADAISDQFPSFDSPLWYQYDNPIEIKRVCNQWDRFPPETYQAFWALCSREFSTLLSHKFKIPLFADIGLNGGGWHMHGVGGKLNVHKDYSLHPKVPYQRKLNIIIYMSKDWNPSWGGGLQLWSHDEETDKPKDRVKYVDVRFNRAVLFDTTQNSWHGLPEPLSCPQGVFRKSLALYYVTPADNSVDPRYRALFAPTKEQETDPSVLELIQKRCYVQR